MTTTTKKTSKKAATKKVTKKVVTKKTPAKKVQDRVAAVSADALAALPTPKEEAAAIIKDKTEQQPKKEPNHKKEPKVSKMSRCAEIFEHDFILESHKRKDTIARFMDEVGLSKAGASTYYQTLKKRHFEDEM